MRMGTGNSLAYDYRKINSSWCMTTNVVELMQLENIYEVIGILSI